MSKIKVHSLKSPKTGRPVANQFEIYESTKKMISYTFQSYDTIIAKCIFKNDKHIVILDNDALYYSRTTSKYLYKFLDSRSHLNFGMRKKEILKAIKEGEILTKNLN